MISDQEIIWSIFLLSVLISTAIPIDLRSQFLTEIYSTGTINYTREYKYGVCFHAYADYNEATKEILSNMGRIWIRSDWVVRDYMYSWKNDMKKMGIKVLGIINSATLKWNTPPFPENYTLEDWERIVRQIARSAPDVDAWEIWNEPNAARFQYGYMDGTPEHYLDMLKIAYNTIKGESNALVAGPALSPIPGWIEWLQRFVDLGGLNYLDVVSIHLYYNTLSGNQKYLNQVKSIVGNKPIWVTEIGKPSAYTGTEETQNAYLTQNFDPETGLQADKLFWYELVDDPSKSGTHSGYYGLIRADYTFKPSYYTFKSLVG